MFSSAGSRITRQQGEGAELSDELRHAYQRFAKGNSLYRSLGGGKFEEVPAAGGAEMGRWAWSSMFADLNNDSWDDIVVANGYLTNDDTHDL
jgi:hypothetical protein